MVNSLLPVDSPSSSNKERTIEWFERVWNHGDEEHIRRRMAPNVILHGLGRPDGGVDTFVDFQRTFLEAFDDVWIEVFEFMENGDFVMGTSNFTAIHRATRKPVDINFSFSVTWKDGVMVESRNIIDFSKMLEQVGVIDKHLLTSVVTAPKTA